MDDALPWKVDFSRPASARQEIARCSSAQKSYLKVKMRENQDLFIRKTQKKQENVNFKGIRLRIFGNGLVARLAAALGSEVDSRFVSQ